MRNGRKRLIDMTWGEWWAVSCQGISALLAIKIIERATITAYRVLVFETDGQLWTLKLVDSDDLAVNNLNEIGLIFVHLLEHGDEDVLLVVD